MAHSTELVIHVDDTLGEGRRHDVEETLGTRSGVYDAHFSDRRPHLMVVEYDPDVVTHSDILNQMETQHLHAERVG